MCAYVVSVGALCALCALRRAQWFHFHREYRYDCLPIIGKPRLRMLHVMMSNAFFRLNVSELTALPFGILFP